MNALPLALSISSSFTKVGAIVAFAALLGIAVLSLLVFSQAREIKRLREWAGRAPERAAEAEQRVSDVAAARIQSGPTPPGARVAEGARVVPRKTPLVSAPVSTAVNATASAAVPGASSAEVAPAVGGAPAIPAFQGEAAQGSPTSESSVSGEPKSNSSEEAPAPAEAPSGVSPISPVAEGASVGSPTPGTGQGESALAPATAAAVARAPLPPSPAAPAPPGARVAAASAPLGASASAQPATASEREDSGSIPAAPRSAASTRPPAPVAAAQRTPSRTVAAAGATAPARSPSPRVRAGAPAQGGRPSSPRAAESSAGTGGAGGPKYFKQERSPARALVLIVGGVIVVALVLVFAVSALKGGGGTPAPSTSTQSPATSEASSTTTHTITHTSTQAASNPADTAVTVLNGTGTAGLAHHLASDLQQGGYSQAEASSSVPAGTHPTTVVEYTSGHRADAQAVARSLNVTQVQPIDSATAGLAGSANVVVLAGADQAALLGGGSAQSQGEPAATP